MATFRIRNLRSPDQTIRLPKADADVVNLGELTVGREVDAPGWRWSTHMRPLVGGDWCESHHVGVLLSGRAGFLLRDGTTFELGPDDVFEVPPGHDSWTIGDEPAVYVEWSGLRTWAGPAAPFGDRVLKTLLFTDVVDSTARLRALGDAGWRELLARHYAAARELLAEQRGHLVDTTGDGLFATFDAPARAIRFGLALRAHARQEGLGIRVGVHSGEVEVVEQGVRGLAVHEAARVMSSAGPDEILVSEVTRGLTSDGGVPYEDRGWHELKGIEGPRRLYAVTEAT